MAVEWEGSPARLTILIDITEWKQAEEALRDKLETPGDHKFSQA